MVPLLCNINLSHTVPCSLTKNCPSCNLWLHRMLSYLTVFLFWGKQNKYVIWYACSHWECMTISYVYFVCRLGWLIRFISHSVISGFTTASAIVIGLSQIKYFLGYNVTRSSKIIPLIQSIIAGADQVGFIVSPWFYLLPSHSQYFFSLFSC